MDEVTNDAEPENGAGPSLPYLPFQTFWSFIGELCAKPLPPQIDRSMMGSKSGTDQSNLMGALKFFGLVGDHSEVKPALTAFASIDEAGRKQALMSMLRQRYPNQFEVSDKNGTEKQLLETFDPYTGDTKRKAMTFFLHAARFSGIEVSPHFPVTRMGSGRRASSSAKRTPKPRPPILDPTATHPKPKAHGEHVRVEFGEAGFVDVNIQVNWIDLDDVAFAGLRKIVKDLQALAPSEEGAVTDASEEPEL
jgi:hypothetical protein